MRIALLTAGPKGANFLQNFCGNANVAFVVSYASKGLQVDAYADIQSICRAKGYRLLGRESVFPEHFATVDLVFLAGWQWLSKEVDRRSVIFHDSLLPKLRGFNPTVTALISGETTTGVTAFSPVGGDASVADFWTDIRAREDINTISCDDPSRIRSAWLGLLPTCRSPARCCSFGSAVVRGSGRCRRDLFAVA